MYCFNVYYNDKLEEIKLKEKSYFKNLKSFIKTYFDLEDIDNYHLSCDAIDLNSELVKDEKTIKEIFKDKKMVSITLCLKNLLTINDLKTSDKMSSNRKLKNEDFKALDERVNHKDKDVYNQISMEKEENDECQSPCVVTRTEKQNISALPSQGFNFSPLQTIREDLNVLNLIPIYNRNRQNSENNVSTLSKSNDYCNSRRSSQFISTFKDKKNDLSLARENKRKERSDNEFIVTFIFKNLKAIDKFKGASTIKDLFKSVESIFHSELGGNTCFELKYLTQSLSEIDENTPIKHYFLMNNQSNPYESNYEINVFEKIQEGLNLYCKLHSLNIVSLCLDCYELLCHFCTSRKEKIRKENGMNKIICEHKTIKDLYLNNRPNYSSINELLRQSVITMKKKDSKDIISLESYLYKSFSDTLDILHEIKNFHKKKLEEFKCFLIEYDKILSEFDCDGGFHPDDTFKKQSHSHPIQKCTSLIQKLKSKSTLSFQERKCFFDKVKNTNESIQTLIFPFLEGLRNTSDFKSTICSRRFDNIKPSNLRNK
jgi:hypothetical protein